MIKNKHIIKIKELISDEVCMGTYGLVELELLEMEKELTSNDSPKLPSLSTVLKEYNPLEKEEKNTITIVYETIKKLMKEGE